MAIRPTHLVAAAAVIVTAASAPAARGGLVRPTAGPAPSVCVLTGLSDRAAGSEAAAGSGVAVSATPVDRPAVTRSAPASLDRVAAVVPAAFGPAAGTPPLTIPLPAAVWLFPVGAATAAAAGRRFRRRTA